MFYRPVWCTFYTPCGWQMHRKKKNWKNIYKNVSNVCLLQDEVMNDLFSSCLSLFFKCFLWKWIFFLEWESHNKIFWLKYIACISLICSKWSFNIYSIIELTFCVFFFILLLFISLGLPLMWHTLPISLTTFNLYFLLPFSCLSSFVVFFLFPLVLNMANTKQRMVSLRTAHDLTKETGWAFFLPISLVVTTTDPATVSKHNC